MDILNSTSILVEWKLVVPSDNVTTYQVNISQISGPNDELKIVVDTIEVEELETIITDLGKNQLHHTY